MPKTKILTLFSFALISVLSVAAQDKWDLRRCVEYAISHNISVKQGDIDARTAKLSYDQSKMAQYGSANAATAMGLNYGRSINQTTNVYTNTQGISQYYTLNASVTLFNWFSMKRATEANKLFYDSRTVNIDKLKNDVTLSVSAGYLNALLAKQQVTLAQTKLSLTSEQLGNTRKLVNAGSLPELNAAELEVQFATDTAAVITAQETYDINVLQLKATLNLDAAAPSTWIPRQWKLFRWNLLPRCNLILFIVLPKALSPTEIKRFIHPGLSKDGGGKSRQTISDTFGLWRIGR